MQREGNISEPYSNGNVMKALTVSIIIDHIISESLNSSSKAVISLRLSEKRAAAVVAVISSFKSGLVGPRRGGKH